MHLYVSTDPLEAMSLIEKKRPDQRPQHTYHIIDAECGKILEQRIGFNPMCSVELSQPISPRSVEEIATRLVKEGIYVATEQGPNRHVYVPDDSRSREWTIRLALQKTIIDPYDLKRRG